MNSDLKNHWIIDRPHSDKKNETEVDRAIIDAIISKVDVRKNLLDDLMSNMEFTEKDYFQGVPKLRLDGLLNYKNYYGKTQKWIGYIIQIRKSTFKARLEDKNNPGTYEIASFDFDEVSKGDQELVSIGAVFYWSVGFATINSQVTKQSLIRFKRCVDFTEEEIDTIVDKANYLKDNIVWD